MDIIKRRQQVDHRYYSPEFLSLVESNMGYLRRHANVTPHVITQQQSYKFQGDLYGLLREIGVPRQYHQVIARFNGYRGSSDFRGDELTIDIPDTSAVDMLLKLLHTTKI